MNPILWRAAWFARWLARISGTLLVLFFLALVLGEGPPPLASMSPHERAYWCGLLVLFGGLVVAWFAEGWGGILTLAGWLFLWLLAGRAPLAAMFGIPAGIAGVHILCWLVLRNPAPELAPVPSAARMVFRFIWAGLAVFLLLCANEIFGQPPLMTPALHPSRELIGQWQATYPSQLQANIEIHPDASVTGTIGESALQNGRIANNRTWFGRCMHWRADYSLEGELAHSIHPRAGAEGDRIHAAFSPGNARLAGGLSVAEAGRQGQPFRLILMRRQ